MNRRGATIVLAGILIAVLFAAVATDDDVRYIDGAPSFARRPADDAPTETLPPVEVVEIELDERAPIRIPDWVTTVMQSILWLCVIALGVLAAVWLWRNRPRLRWRRRRRAPAFDDLDEVAAAITADAARQRAALQHGAARNAIVECWLRLEAAVGDAGITRHPADTSAELTERVLARSEVDASAARRLAGLYREARFSTHDMGEDARLAAIESLDEVHAGLRRRLDDGPSASPRSPDRVGS